MTLSPIDRIASAIKSAYKSLVSRVVGSAKVSAVAGAIEASPELAARALALGQMTEITELSRSGYIEGGITQNIKLPNGLIADFSPSEVWLSGNAARIIESANNDNHAAIMSVITAGNRTGKSSSEIALDIIGRINKQTGQRVGGVIGLTGHDAQMIMDVYDQLRSGDPDQLEAYLSRKDRFKLFDKLVQQARDAGKAVGSTDAARIQAAYAQVKLERHQELVASHEAHLAYNKGVFDVYSGLRYQDRQPTSIIKIWQSKGDNRVRPDHVKLNGQRVAIDQPFVVGGQRLMFPGDDSLGATWKELANCRCILSYRVTWV